MVVDYIRAVQILVKVVFSMSIECTETIFTADFWCLGAVACKLDRYFAKRWSRMRRRQWLSRSTQAMKHNCSIWKL